MIAGFRHRGLRRLFETYDRSRIPPQHVERIRLILADLDAAGSIEHLHRPGYRLHALKGRLRGHYAIDVSANWRIVFRFEAGYASNIDLMDYH